MIPNEEDKIFEFLFKSFILLITVVLNIIFLNLIIAMVVESYQ